MNKYICCNYNLNKNIFLISNKILIINLHISINYKTNYHIILKTLIYKIISLLILINIILYLILIYQSIKSNYLFKDYQTKYINYKILLTKMILNNNYYINN